MPATEDSEVAGGLHALRRRHGWAFRPRAWIYWLDLVTSSAVGWGAFAVAVVATPFSAVHLLASVVSVAALLRGVLFIHEIAHRITTGIRGFDLAWHALVGLPLQAPSLMYWTHADHHRRSTYGTDRDPEWAPIERWGRLRLLLFVGMVVPVPALLVLRWAVLGPLSWVCPPLRRLVVERLSTLVINPAYRRPPLEPGVRRRFVLEEAAGGAVAWGGALALAQGWLPAAVFVQWFATLAGMLVVNQLRTLAAHRYVEHAHGFETEDQLLDSINLLGTSPVTPILAPVGLRYHALHHLLPGVPYHALGPLHRRLLAELPPDASYRCTGRDTIGSVVRQAWSRAGWLRTT